MAKLVYALNQSLDGYVDHDRMAPDPELFRHFIEDMRGLGGVLYGRRMYETMRYWDEDQPGWSEAEREYALAWRSQPKWVVSRTLDQAGPNARLVSEELEAAVAQLRSAAGADIEVAGPELAGFLTDRGLIDEYRLYMHPVVLGGGKPYFTGPRPPLRLIEATRIGGEVIRLCYAPA